MHTCTHTCTCTKLRLDEWKVYQLMGPGGGSALTSCSRCGDVSRSLELSCLCVSSPLSPLLLLPPHPLTGSGSEGLSRAPLHPAPAVLHPAHLRDGDARLGQVSRAPTSFQTTLYFYVVLFFASIKKKSTSLSFPLIYHLKDLKGEFCLFLVFNGVVLCLNGVGPFQGFSSGCSVPVKSFLIG